MGGRPEPSGSGDTDAAMPRVWTRYGVPWAPGSVVGCLLDGVEGTLSFSVDGEDCGIAFTGLDLNVSWFPAASIGLGQHVGPCTVRCRSGCGRRPDRTRVTLIHQVRFNFGATPFCYSVPGCLSVLSLVLESSLCSDSLLQHLR